MSQFLKKNIKETADFVSLLRKAVGNPQLWVPGLANGGIQGVLNALNTLSDEEIVRVIRESCKK